MLQLLTRGKKRRRRSRGGSGIPVLGVVLRWFTPGLTLTGVIAFLGALLTGNIDLSSLESLRGSTEPVYEEPLAQTLPPEMRGPDVTLPARPKSNIAPVSLQRPASNNHATITHGNRPGDAIRIGSFNIQVFGETKSSKPDVMQHIARIVSYFDVLGIQEIRGDSNAIMGRLLGALRSQGLRYQAVTSPPIGRTSQTESYGFIWDPDRVKLVPQSQYVVGDGEGQNDLLHREPMVATFEAVSRWPSRAPFRFTVINMHTDPDEVAGPGPYNELNVLDDVFRRVRDFEWHSFGEEDFILLGDLNVAVKGLAELGQIPGMGSLGGDAPTNVRRTKVYDHILIDRLTTQEFTGRAGVLDLQQLLGVDEATERSISDHLPVWAEFYPYEAPPSRSSRP